eukprot:CAMPEP_0117004766 /NCGR_PEP_ID=MMETSP0472-20121206/5627_1 /TAXON_ID=693140 ORGANISM="Tiarina fusus, Strain LIS" /NCGR_SAMPLE_ID=MMETSP0472 /ASSEMBLY_ACC=CAM_ASM_000603 /LENGTH=150 /DNA_ID=CAMNT_0004705825 /DNA_START=152 /DNA_END=600 /DNA_ORIENTATION=-
MTMVVDLINTPSMFYLDDMYCTSTSGGIISATPFATGSIHAKFIARDEGLTGSSDVKCDLKYRDTVYNHYTLFFRFQYIRNAGSVGTTGEMRFIVKVLDVTAVFQKIEDKGSKFAHDYQTYLTNNSWDCRSVFSCDLGSNSPDVCHAHAG